MKTKRFCPKRVCVLSFVVVILAISSNVIMASSDLVYEKNLNSIEEFDEMVYANRLVKVILNAGLSGTVLVGEGVNDDGTLTLDNKTEKNFRITRQDYKLNDDGHLFNEFGPVAWNQSNGDQHPIFELNGEMYYIHEILEDELVVQKFMLNKEKDFGIFNFHGVYIIKPFISGELLQKARESQNYDQVDMLQNTWKRMEVIAEGEVKGTHYEYFENEDKVYLGFTLTNDVEEITFIVNNEEIVKNLRTFEGMYTEGFEEEIIELSVALEIQTGYFDKDRSTAGPVEVAIVALVSFALATSASGVIGSFGSSSNNFLENSEGRTYEKKEPDEAQESQEDAENFEMIVNNNEGLPPICNTEKASVIFPVCIEGGEGLMWSYHVVAYPLKPDIFIPSIMNYGFDNTAQLSIQLTGKKLKTDSITVILHIIASAKENGKVIGEAKKTMEATLYNLGLMVELKDKTKGIIKDNTVVTEVSSSKIKGIAELKKLTVDDYYINESSKKVIRKK